MDIKVDLEKYTDTQIITFHRQYVISNGEFISEFRRRGYDDEYIRELAMTNVSVRNPELECLDWLN